MSEAAQEYTLPTPTEEHHRLQPFEGTFSAAVKMWMGPGDPMESTGTMTNTWHLGGLYLNQDYVGDATDGPFPNFAGKGYWGYNPTAEKYEGFWIDTAASMFQVESGNVDDSGKVWTMHSEVQCPQTAEPMKKRTVITLKDDNHHSIEMFFTMPDGNEMKAMEINYTRK